MEKYKNLGGTSAIIGYEPGVNFIKVLFKPGKSENLYTYEASRIGVDKIGKMKELAERGQGLGTYINGDKSVRNGYSIHVPLCGAHLIPYG